LLLLLLLLLESKDYSDTITQKDTLQGHATVNIEM